MNSNLPLRPSIRVANLLIEVTAPAGLNHQQATFFTYELNGANPGCPPTRAVELSLVQLTAAVRHRFELPPAATLQFTCVYPDDNTTVPVRTVYELQYFVLKTINGMGSLLRLTFAVGQ